MLHLNKIYLHEAVKVEGRNSHACAAACSSMYSVSQDCCAKRGELLCQTKSCLFKKAGFVKPMENATIFLQQGGTFDVIALNPALGTVSKLNKQCIEVSLVQ